MSRSLPYLVCALTAGAIGVVHSVVGVAGLSTPSQDDMWFTGAGLYMVMSAALGVQDARAPVKVSRSQALVRANHWAVLIFALVTGWLGTPTLVEWALVVGAYGGMAVLGSMSAFSGARA